jgi:hypothetical protein
MDCQHENNKCDEIFGECRCYADVETSNPLTQQKCGIRKNGYVIPCKSGCCDGGCPGQCIGVEPRQPFSYGKFNYPVDVDMKGFFRTSLIFAVILVIYSTILVYRKRT